MVSGSSLGPADPNLKVGENERVELLQEHDFRFLCKANQNLSIWAPQLSKYIRRKTA